MKISKNFDSSADIVLYEGSCLDLLKSIPDDFFQLIVTSPPYNIGKEYESKKKIEEYIEIQEKVITECVRVLNQNGSICWQIGNYVNNGEIIPLDIVLYPIFKKLNLKLRNRIIWHFGHGLHCSKRFSGRYEVILWFTKNDDYIFNLDEIRIPQKYPNKKYFKGDRIGEYSCNPLGKNPSDIWEIPNVKSNHIEKTIHPCQFPIELIERLVLSMSNEGGWVYDPFMGVASSLIAALIHKRKAVGSEIVKEYLDISFNRINKAISGDLKIRPMDRPVFDPKIDQEYIPPKKIKIANTNNDNYLFDDFKKEREIKNASSL